MKERLELVTDFATLRAGMIVVAKCEGCNGMHRCFLLHLLRGLDLKKLSGESRRCDKWVGCGSRPKSCPYANPTFWRQEHFGISEWTVDERRAWKVVDGLEYATETRKSVTA